jgi:hypothetical protein
MRGKISYIRFFLLFVHKILVCQLHIPRTTLFQMNSLSLHATEQLVQRTMQLCVPPPPHKSHDYQLPVDAGNSVTLKVIWYTFRPYDKRELYGVFSGEWGGECALWSRKYSVLSLKSFSVSTLCDGSQTWSFSIHVWCNIHTHQNWHAHSQTIFTQI